MERRTFLSASLGAAALAGFADAAPTPLPRRKKTKVAFMIGKGTNVIDMAGPWEVFQDTTFDDDDVFELFTVGPDEELLKFTGGLQVKPHYSIEKAPQPHVIVVPAQGATDKTRAWLRQASVETDVTMSVCTGRFPARACRAARWKARDHASRLLGQVRQGVSESRAATRIAFRRQRQHRDSRWTDLRHRPGAACRLALLRPGYRGGNGAVHGIFERGVANLVLEPVAEFQQQLLVVAQIEAVAERLVGVAGGYIFLVSAAAVHDVQK